MNTLAHLVPISSNSKTGPIAVSMTEQSSCAPTCPLKGHGCYASYGHVLLHWSKVATRGLPWPAFCEAVSSTVSSLFRHNVAGDLPHVDGNISEPLVIQLLAAVQHFKAAWTYTHHVLNEHNKVIIWHLTAWGFTTNLSCEDPTIAAAHHIAGFPAVCVVPLDTPSCFRHDGVTFVQCPATLKEGINCINCGGHGGIPLCARADRSCVVTFPVHGIGKKKVAAVLTTPVSHPPNPPSSMVHLHIDDDCESSQIASPYGRRYAGFLEDPAYWELPSSDTDNSDQEEDDPDFY